MNKEKSKEIISILRNVIPNPVCELNFNNNFELICAVMLSAQTTDKRVNMITPNLFEKYSNPEKLMNAEFSDVKNIISSVGLANSKAKNLISMAKIIHEKHEDVIPNTMEELSSLPGVGRKTASVVLSVGFKIPAMPVDTHLHRMAIRLGYVKKEATVLNAEEAFKKYIPKSDWIDAHHLLLLFGRYHCKAINPNCDDCCLKKYCKVKSR